MSKAVGRRAHVLEIRKLLNQKKYDIGVESDVLVYDAERAASLEKAKQHYASCRIQGIVRGFLARIHARNLLVEFRAGSLICKIARGKLGRMRWMLEYWKSISVVKSAEALDALLERSVTHRDSKEAGGPSWREYYDPVSGAFWCVSPVYACLCMYMHVLYIPLLLPSLSLTLLCQRKTHKNMYYPHQVRIYIYISIYIMCLSCCLSCCLYPCLSLSLPHSY